MSKNIEAAELGKRVEAARLARNMTQAQLADGAGVTQSFVSQLERGDIANAGWRTVRDIEKALGLRHGQLTRAQQHQSN